MRRRLIQFLLWALRKLEVFPEYFFNYGGLMAFVEAAVPLVESWEIEESEFAGEYKRHQVYARLIKLFPDAERIDLAQAIELALRKIRGLL
jgi:hypothetical protein